MSVRSVFSVVPAALIALAVIVISCGDTVENNFPGNASVTYEFTFATSTEGWTEGFAEYPPGKIWDNYYEISFAYAQLPSNLGQKNFGLLISGNNHNADLFMYIKRRLDNLKPGADYNVVFRIEIASNASENASGAVVYLKAGASLVEPLAFIENEYYCMNIDKGNNSSGGKDAVFLGNIGVSGNIDDTVYKLKVLENSTPFPVSADDTGSLWVFAGTDSAFEGITGIYYSSIKITLSEQ